MRPVALVGVLALALAGCVGGGTVEERLVIQECPPIEPADFPIAELPTDRPTQPEHVEPWWLRAEEAYLSCRDAVDGYRDILDRAREAR